MKAFIKTIIVTAISSFPVLNVGKFGESSSRINYVPLHGSFDFAKIRRPKGSGIYEDIFKISDPMGYFEGKPDISNVFMIYPLEAIGYEESVKSPYLDMLNDFKSSLRNEGTVFVIGYSLRDPTIGSIFEEVIAERIRKGDLNLLSEDLNSRKNEVSGHRLKIIVINRNPDTLVENLRKQRNTNLLQTFVPIKIEFPKITDEDFDAKYTQALSQLIKDLRQIGCMGPSNQSIVVSVLKEKYGVKEEELSL